MRTIQHSTVAAAIVDLGERRSFAPGDLMFVEGDRSQSVYACIEGRVRLFLTMPSGRELLIGIKTSGDEFGELSAIDGRPRSATAAALDPTVVAVLRADRFMDLLVAEPHLSVSVCQSLSAELRRANERLVTRNSDSAVVRTGRMLVELASMRMRHDRADGSFDLALTQSDLAAWIGATRESTARALARFRRAGLVETRRGCITVVDVVGLNRLVATAP
ncbi:MAG TPA: Crp/Fnr family transcriptional regulator [Ilumatobacteraceae bacterium]|nr:Crp/Fnr family transcriptional regulator [Ilumatobacteraceae bacterium]